MGTDAFNEENNGENGMRQAIIKAVLRAISVFLILYFLTVGFQYVGWKHKLSTYLASAPIRTYYYGTLEPIHEPELEQHLLHFYSELWPFYDHEVF
jgi:hypothetical protein